MILARLTITIAVALTIPLVARSLHGREFPSRDDPAKSDKVIRDHNIKDER